MHDAAVGFQCPSCVAEGRRTTRAGRTTYGGRPSADPRATSLVLIGLNVAVWLALTLVGPAAPRLVYELVIIPGSVAQGAVWQVVTNAFTHTSLLHLALNMVAVYVLGPQLEQLLGRGRFLALYLVAALSASALVMWAAAPFQATLGASGAVFGLFASYLVVALKVKADLQPILVILGINLLITVVGRSFISWQGHLGGFVGGLALALVLVYSPRRQRARWQWTGVAVVSFLALAAIAARVLVLR